ncbi:MAG: hypothetical protein LBN08_01435 [Lactobacillales bacterium]|jgi:hypothetical protein|nr:hypothetical protein [Lactobacillales bacterium]
MTEKEKAEAIAEKYNRSYGELSKNATPEEFRTFLMYVASESNRLQRKAIGLEE